MPDAIHREPPAATPEPIRAAKCRGCDRTYCVCPRPPLALRIVATDEAIEIIDAAVAAGETVKVASAVEALAAIFEMAGAA